MEHLDSIILPSVVLNFTISGQLKCCCMPSDISGSSELEPIQSLIGLSYLFCSFDILTACFELADAWNGKERLSV